MYCSVPFVDITVLLQSTAECIPLISSHRAVEVLMHKRSKFLKASNVSWFINILIGTWFEKQQHMAISKMVGKASVQGSPVEGLVFSWRHNWKVTASVWGKWDPLVEVEAWLWMLCLRKVCVRTHFCPYFLYPAANNLALALLCCLEMLPYFRPQEMELADPRTEISQTVGQNTPSLCFLRYFVQQQRVAHASMENITMVWKYSTSKRQVLSQCHYENSLYFKDASVFRRSHWSHFKISWPKGSASGQLFVFLPWVYFP